MNAAPTPAELAELRAVYPMVALRISPGRDGNVYEAWLPGAPEGLYAVVTSSGPELRAVLDAGLAAAARQVSAPCPGYRIAIATRWRGRRVFEAVRTAGAGPLIGYARPSAPPRGAVAMRRLRRGAGPPGGGGR